MRLRVFGQISGKFVLVGTLETFAERREEFSYDDRFLVDYPGAVLSHAFPLSKGSFPYRQMRPYFQGLLPEGGALASIARRLEVESTSYLKVLQAIGYECIGAVAIVDDGDDAIEAFASDALEPAYEPIAPDLLAQFGAGDDKDAADLSVRAKLSLAGAQSKAGVLVQRDGSGSRIYALPLGGAASTHIAKSSNRRFESLSENELFCMRLAESCGLNVPDAFVEHVEGHPIFVVERYDRKRDDRGTVLRLHQEDLCQALGRLPEQKYERPGQNLARQVYDFITGMSEDPIADTKQFLMLLVFNLVVGNCDCHLKNIAWMRGERWDGNRLAPFYDLSSTAVYAGLDRNLAFRYGSLTKVDDPRRDDLLAMADELGASRRQLGKVVDAVCEALGDSARDQASALEEELGYEVPKLHQIADFVERQIRSLSVV